MLGVAALQRGESRRAIDLIGQAIALSPSLAGAHANLGTALLAQGRFQEALDCYERALQVTPDSAGLLFNRGNVLRRLARHQEALASYERALARRPDHADALCNRGMTLLDLGRPLEALASFESELRLRPGDPIALTNRSHALLELKRAEEALEDCERALVRNPEYVDAHYNRGSALLDLGRLRDALSSFDRVLALDPNHPKAHHNRGNALFLLVRLDEALQSYDRALELQPDYLSALYNRGDLLQALLRHEEAVRCFATVLAAAPGYDYALGQWVHSRLRCCDWADHDLAMRELVRSVADGQRTVTPFAFLTAVDSPALLQKCARLFVADRCNPQPPLWTGQHYRHERIRVAYLSADFHDHATAYLMAGLFERHDRGRFEITAVSFGPDDGGAMRARLQRAFDRFADVRAQSDREIAQLLRDWEIDIAVDLKGFTNGARPQVLACRPTPIQVNYLGFPGTMGAQYMDYILADRHVIPPESQGDYSEKVVYLPECYQVNDFTRKVATCTPTRVELELPEQGFVFCCFNNSYKVTPQFFDIWMRLLRRVDGSVLWLIQENHAAVRNLRREAVSRGIAPERLIFAPRAPVEEHLARHRFAELFLDTLPCNAHTTASDALWAGLPVLTCVGSSFAGRVAASLLHAVGFPELITSSPAEYEERAFKLATTPALLTQIRARLANKRGTCPLFDTERFSRHLEQAYTTMWERARRGEPPAAFAVPVSVAPDA